MLPHECHNNIPGNQVTAKCIGRIMGRTNLWLNYSNSDDGASSPLRTFAAVINKVDTIHDLERAMPVKSAIEVEAEAEAARVRGPRVDSNTEKHPLPKLDVLCLCLSIKTGRIWP